MSSNSGTPYHAFYLLIDKFHFCSLIFKQLMCYYIHIAKYSEVDWLTERLEGQINDFINQLQEASVID